MQPDDLSATNNHEDVNPDGAVPPVAHRRHQHNHQHAHNNNLGHLINISIFQFWDEGTKFLDEVMKQFGIYDAFDCIAKHLARHPILAFGISAGILSIALPFLIFTLFALATIVMTFTGFVVIEGTLITIASVLLFGFLGSVFIILLFFGAVIVAGYFGFMHIYDLFDSTNQRNALNKFIIKEKTTASPAHKCPQHAAMSAN